MASEGAFYRKVLATEERRVQALSIVLGNCLITPYKCRDYYNSLARF